MPKPPQSLEERKAQLLARYSRLAEKAGSRSPALPRPIDLITLGVDDDNRRITIDDRPRLEHMHVIGATGCGKSTFLLNCILQDVARGRGVCVLDPHGGHPDSLINTVLRFLDDHNWFAARKVHIIAPNVREHVVGFNPLAPLPDTDPAVIAGAMLEAFARVWGDEDSHKTPLTRRILRNIFIALSECGLTLADAPLLLDYDDHRLREYVIPRVEDENARREIERIEALSREQRSRVEYEQTVLGPTNRLAEFLACDAMRTMLAMTRAGATPDNTIDLLEIMNRGHILLVDLQHGPSADEAATDLLGRMILRYLLMLMTHRSPYRTAGSDQLAFHPFFVYVDECHRYMSEDIQGLLTEARKFGIGVTLAHQYLAQLGLPGEKIYEAVRNSTEIKAVFRVKSPEEAQALALDVVPLDLERPVTASIRPVQTDYEIGMLHSASYAVHEGEGQSEAVHAAEAVSRGRTAMQNWMRAIGRATSTARGEGIGSSTGIATAQGLNAVQSHMDSMAYTYDPNSGTFITMPLPLGVNVGTADGTATALLSSTSFQSSESRNSFRSTTDSESVSDGEGGAIAFSEALSKSQGTSHAQHKTRGKTEGGGASQALLPTYERLPTSYHSKDNVLYMAGETIRSLPVGRAIVRFRNNLTTLTVPQPRKPISRRP